MRRAGAIARPACLIVCASLWLASQPVARAQNANWTQQQPLATELQLRALTEVLRENEARTDVLRSQADIIEADRAELNRRLIDTAERIKASEAQIEEAEERLVRLNERQDKLRISLATERHAMTELLAALQKLGTTPPPALVVKPEDALEAIRSALLLGTVVPELRTRAQKISADLKDLVALRDAISTEKARLSRSTVAIAEERTHIETLLDAKRASLAATRQQVAEAQQKSDRLSRETRTLKELIARMDATVAPPAAKRPPPIDPRLALSDPGRIQPAMDFVSAMGMLPMPANGTLVSHFGDPDETGASSRGMTISTRPGAQVTAPADGWIVYAGKFRSYGQLLILNAGGGYHVVLAGLDRINVDVGQFVLVGEPIGQMGHIAALGRTYSPDTASERPILYVEFRKDGNSIDPSPWWASAEQKVRG